MDINDKINARREELARQRREDRATAAAAAKLKREADAEAAERARVAEEARSAAAREQRERVLDEVAASLSADGPRVARDGEELELPSPELETIDPEAVKQRALARLLSREARRSWTAAENWIVIGCVVGGAVFTLQEPFGLAVVVLGIWAGVMAQRDHRRKLIQKHPHLFAAIADAHVTTPAGEPTLWQKLFWNPHAGK